VSDKAQRLAVAEATLATLASSALKLDGEAYITHSDTLRVVGILYGIRDGGAEHYVRKARNAGRLRTIAPHPRARFYASADVLKLLKGDE
jgi:hypothetical protein